MYFPKLGIFVVGEYSSPLKGLSKLGVGLYSDAGRLCGTVTTAGATREEERGRECFVQLRKAGPAPEARGRIFAIRVGSLCGRLRSRRLSLTFSIQGTEIW